MLFQKEPTSPAGNLFRRHPCRLELRPVDMWKSGFAGTRLKGVDKPVDGQRAARPPACPPRAAFPHTHRRNSPFFKPPRSRTTSPASQPDSFFGGSRPLLRREKKDESSNGAGYSRFYSPYGEFYSLYRERFSPYGEYCTNQSIKLPQLWGIKKRRYNPRIWGIT
jgi:hypothetical protein